MSLKIRIINPLCIVDSNINDIFVNKDTDSFLKSIKDDVESIIEYFNEEYKSIHEMVWNNEFITYKTKNTTFLIWDE